jgi:hypothetical protein
MPIFIRRLHQVPTHERIGGRRALGPANARERTVLGVTAFDQLSEKAAR